jgi:hypothetical protein
VGGCNQVYIVTAHVLQSQHHPGDVIPANNLSLAQLADGIVLAEGALQIAVGKENRTGAVPTHQR